MSKKIDPFMIVHLSDLHLTAGPKARRTGMPPRLIGMNNAFEYVLASELVKKADLILVTGDVTDRGEEKAWSFFVEALTSAGVKSKTLAIIGNHDVCSLRMRVGRRATLAESDLKHAYKGLTIAGQPANYPWDKVVDSRVVVIGLDSNNSGNRTVFNNAKGRIGEDQLQDFARLLAKHHDVPVKLVAIHHSRNIPANKIAEKRGQKGMSKFDRHFHEMEPENRREFRRLCIEGNVRLVAHGHVHQAQERRVSGLRIIGAPPTTEPIDAKAETKQYQIYRYAVRRNGGRVDSKLLPV